MIQQKALIKILLVFSLIIFNSCSEKHSKSEKIDANPYSISFGSFRNYERASQFKTKLSNEVRANLRLEYIGKKKYKLLYGRYPNSYMAGQAAYQLLCDSLIQDYEITRDGLKVLDEFINVPFIAYYLENTCVFNYNILTKNIELVWSRLYEKVVSMNLTRYADAAFIISAQNYGKDLKVPLVQNASLYYLHRNEEYSEVIEELGSGYQTYTYWDSPDTFRVNITFPDSLNARKVNQKILSWDSFGRRGKQTSRSFDLLRQGFPKPPDRKPVRLSNNNQLELRLVQNKGKTFFYLKNFSDKSEVLITSTINNVKDARWSLDDKYIFIITEAKIKDEKKKSEIPGQIIIINTEQRKVEKIIDGSGFQNLLVRGKLVFFDELFAGMHRISIYDYKLKKKFGSIERYGGCALNSLPY